MPSRVKSKTEQVATYTDVSVNSDSDSICVRMSESMSRSTLPALVLCTNTCSIIYASYAPKRGMCHLKFQNFPGIIVPPDSQGGKGDPPALIPSRVFIAVCKGLTPGVGTEASESVPRPQIQNCLSSRVYGWLTECRLMLRCCVSVIGFLLRERVHHSRGCNW